MKSQKCITGMLACLLLVSASANAADRKSRQQPGDLSCEEREKLLVRKLAVLTRVSPGSLADRQTVAEDVRQVGVLPELEAYLVCLAGGDAKPR